MIVIDKPVSLKKILADRQTGFSDMIKIVVDIEREIIAADAELHADLEEMMLEQGSVQQHLWGANIYPQKSGGDFIEYTAFINIRPSQANRSMEIEDADIRRKIEDIIDRKIIR